MRGGWRAVVASAFALANGLAGASLAGEPAPAAPGVRAIELQTAWPAHIACQRFERIDIIADDAIDTIEWRDRDGVRASYTLERSTDREPYHYQRKGSESIECGMEETSCILYPRHVEPLRGFNAVRGGQSVGADFPSGQLTTLIARTGNRASTPWKVIGTEYRFGIELTLLCADPASATLQWSCDDKSCALRSRRDRPATDPFPFRNNPLAPTVAWLIDRPAAALAQERTKLDAVARAVLDELAGVIADACAASACSTHVDEVTAAVRSLTSGPALAFRGARPRSESALSEIRPASRGWVARLAGSAGVEIELACARHNEMFVAHAGDPHVRHDQCRITLMRRGRRIADYFPDWFQQLELPDGGAIHPHASASRPPPSNESVEIIGSALASVPAPEEGRR